MGPLSAKQHREYLKFAAQEKRENHKMEREESRKQELHELKLMEASAKAGQSVGHKEELHHYKMGTLGAPLGKSKVKTPNPLAGTEMFHQGQHMLPFQVADAAKARKQSTDTVPAMLTPGEAVIPEPAAQDPKNKPIIKKMVQQGRQANKAKKGFLGFRDGSVNIVNPDASIPTRVQQAAGYSDGTDSVSNYARMDSDDNKSSYNSGALNNNKVMISSDDSKKSNYYVYSNPEDAKAAYEQHKWEHTAEYADGTPAVPQLMNYADGTEMVNKAVEMYSKYTEAKPGYADGTSGVPSLAYRHPDVPGSSFEDGTERVYDFSRGSSDRQYYEDGTDSVNYELLNRKDYNYMEQKAYERQMEDAKRNVTPLSEEQIKEAEQLAYEEDQRRKGLVPPAQVIPIPAPIPVDPVAIKATALEAAVPANTAPSTVNKVEAGNVYQPTITLPVPKVEPVGGADASYDIKERPYKDVGMEVPVLPMYTDKPQQPVVVQGADRFPSPPPVVAKSTGGNNSTIDMPVQVDTTTVPPVDAKQASDEEVQAVLDTNAGKQGKGVPQLKPEDDDTRPEYWIKHLRGSQSDVEKAVSGKDQETATKDLKDYFTYKGIKDLLGLNDQEVARLAVATVGGMFAGYEPGRALSYAGKMAFETSGRRQAQEAQDKRQDKQLKAQQERDDTKFAIQMAGQAKADKKADRAAAIAEKKNELYESNLQLQAKRQEAKDESDAQYRKLQELKADRQWTHQQNQEAYRLEHDRLSAYQKALAADVPNSIRAREIKRVNEAKTYEERLSAMETATTNLSANTRHKEPKDPNAYKPNWQTYVTPNGDTVTASRRPDGNLDVIVPGKGTAVAPNNYAVNHTEKKDNENAIRTIVENRAKGIKGLNESQIGKMKEDAVLMSQQFQHLNPVQFSSAIEKTFSNLKERGESLTSDSFKHAFTTTAIVEMNPTYAALYSGTDESGTSGYLSDNAQIDMGKAMEKLAKSKGGLDAADKDMQRLWSSLDQEQRNTMWRIGSDGKGQDVGVRRKGYSAYSEFVIEMAKPPEQRKYSWLKTIK